MNKQNFRIFIFGSSLMGFFASNSIGSKEKLQHKLRFKIFSKGFSSGDFFNYRILYQSILENHEERELWDENTKSMFPEEFDDVFFKNPIFQEYISCNWPAKYKFLSKIDEWDVQDKGGFLGLNQKVEKRVYYLIMRHWLDRLRRRILADLIAERTRFEIDIVRRGMSTEEVSELKLINPNWVCYYYKINYPFFHMYSPKAHEVYINFLKKELIDFWMKFILQEFFDPERIEDKRKRIVLILSILQKKMELSSEIRLYKKIQEEFPKLPISNSFEREGLEHFINIIKKMHFYSDPYERPTLLNVTNFCDEDQLLTRIRKFLKDFEDFLTQEISFYKEIYYPENDILETEELLPDMEEEYFNKDRKDTTGFFQYQEEYEKPKRIRKIKDRTYIINQEFNQEYAINREGTHNQESDQTLEETHNQESSLNLEGTHNQESDQTLEETHNQESSLNREGTHNQESSLNREGTHNQESDQTLEETQKYRHLWVQCENCYGLNYKKYFFKTKLNICEHCGFNLKMSSLERLELPVDQGTWNPMDEDMISTDPIQFDRNPDPTEGTLVKIDLNLRTDNVWTPTKPNTIPIPTKPDPDPFRFPFPFPFPLDPDQIPFDPDQIPTKPDPITTPIDPDQIPLDPDQIPLDPDQIPLDPDQIPLDPDQIPTKPDPIPTPIKDPIPTPIGDPIPTPIGDPIPTPIKDPIPTPTKADPREAPFKIVSPQEEAENDHICPCKCNEKTCKKKIDIHIHIYPTKCECNKKTCKNKIDIHIYPPKCKCNKKTCKNEICECDKKTCKNEICEFDKKTCKNEICECDKKTCKNKIDIHIHIYPPKCECDKKTTEHRIDIHIHPPKCKCNDLDLEEFIYLESESKEENSKDCIDFEFESEEKDYEDRIDFYQEEIGLTEAVQTGTGQINGIPVAIGVMDFEFMGGSMGSVVGEKITRLIEYASKKGLPLILVCASGGARMQEGSLSLMQMGKISAALKEYKKNKKSPLYISMLTSPTTGGVTASFGMLGDIIITEPDADIAFAGKRVIEQTLNLKVPEDLQTAEYLFEKGLFDLIIPRNLLKNVLSELLKLHAVKNK